MSVHLELLHGAENAFGLLDARAAQSGEDAYRAIARGLEADGLLVVLPSERDDVRMRMFNPDGSEAEMCGNGIRCVARYLDERGEGDRLSIETAAGPIGTRVTSRLPYAVETAIGIPKVGEPEELQALGTTWRYRPVSVGNPHAVVFVADLEAIDLAGAGRAIETSPRFPEGTNVHFVRVAGPSELAVLHWERGAGATRACGTGIVASAAAAIVEGRVVSPVTVRVPGGVLTVEWDGRSAALLTGPVERIGARDVALA